jgi:hypothetical protein
LEPRLVLNAAAPLGGVPQAAIVGEGLEVHGTAGSDRIRIMPTGRSDTVRVFANGRSLGAFGPVKSLDIQGEAGNDAILVGLGVTLPAKIAGGIGNDRIRGGGGPDVVDGDGGDDWLVGSPDRDALDAGSGSNRVTAPQSMGSIWVGPSVRGSEAARDLARSYTLRRWSPATGLPDGPIVVGAADLQDPQVVDLLKQSYGEGQTVALADATDADADQLRQLLGYEGKAEWPADVPKAALVAFRETDLGVRTHHSMDVILPRELSPRLGAAGRRASDERMIGVLSRLFSATPVVPGASPGSSPMNNLLEVADSYQTSMVGTGQYGDQVQIVNSIWAARSFLNSEDLYYVLQEVDYSSTLRVGYWVETSWTNDASNFIYIPSSSPTIIQPSPQTTGSSQSESSTIGYNVGGEIGVQSSGVTALLTGGVSVSNTQTVDFPPVSIANASDYSTGMTAWSYNVNSVGNPASNTVTVTFYNQWIWALPFAAYGPNPTSISIDSGANLNSVYTNLSNFDREDVNVPDTVNTVVPLPFGDTFKLDAPTVTGVSPSTVKAGDSFVITGTSMYPALVQGVLINGVALGPTNYVVNNDNQITVTAPDMPGMNLPVVVQTTQGFSNDDVTITITS